VTKLPLTEEVIIREAIDWNRAAVSGALAGALFWAAAVYAIMATEGVVPVYLGIAGVAAALIVAGAVLYRRPGSMKRRTAGAALFLTPLTGAAPLVVFVVVTLPLRLVSG
jgi:hypothetical protein